MRGSCPWGLWVGRPGLVGEGVLGILDGVFDGFAGLAGAALDAADEFVHLAVGVLEVVVGEVGPLLFEFAFDDVPVAFDFEFIHRGEDRTGCEGVPWGETLMRGVGICGACGGWRWWRRRMDPIRETLEKPVMAGVG